MRTGDAECLACAMRVSSFPASCTAPLPSVHGLSVSPV